jgi:hypothetical protein
MGRFVKIPRGKARSLNSASQGKKDLLPEFVPAYDPELGHYLVSRPPSLLEKLVAKVGGKSVPKPEVKRARGRPRKTAAQLHRPGETSPGMGVAPVGTVTPAAVEPGDE